MSKYDISNKQVPTDTLQLPLDLVLHLSGLQIQIIRITHIRKAETSWQIESHAHLNWEFHYVFSGSGVISTLGRAINVRKQHLYITPPFLLHKQTSNEDCLEEYCIECSLQPPLSFANEFSGNDLMKFLSIRDSVAANAYFMPSYVHSLHAQLQDFLDSETPPLIAIEGLLNFLMSEYFNVAIAGRRKKKFSPAEQSYNWQAITIKNFLDANICNPVTTRDIADLMFISSRQIDRIFTKRYHMTTFQYLQNLRTKAAINLIKNTALPFNEIAVSSGFSNYRQMVRVLHSNHYDSPSEIRSRNQSQPRPESDDKPVMP